MGSIALEAEVVLRSKPTNKQMYETKQLKDELSVVCLFVLVAVNGWNQKRKEKSYLRLFKCSVEQLYTGSRMSSDMLHYEPGVVFPLVSSICSGTCISNALPKYYTTIQFLTHSRAQAVPMLAKHASS